MRIKTTGIITGRNGTFPLKAVEITEGEDGAKEMIRIDGVGKRGLINGGIAMEKEVFLGICRDQLKAKP